MMRTHFLGLAVLVVSTSVTSVVHAEDATTPSIAAQVTPPARRLTPALAFGLPDLLAVRLATSVSERWEVGAALGVLPATQIIDPLSGLKPQDISATYDMELSPTFIAWAPQFFVRYRPTWWQGAFVASAGVLLARASARGTLHHKTTDARATVAEVTATLTQPLVSIAVEYPLASGEGWQLRGTLGAMWLWGPSLRAASTGLLPAFAQTNPEALDNYSDALATAERELTDSLRAWEGRPPLLPTFALALEW